MLVSAPTAVKGFKGTLLGQGRGGFTSYRFALFPCEHTSLLVPNAPCEHLSRLPSMQKRQSEMTRVSHSLWGCCWGVHRESRSFSSAWSMALRGSHMVPQLLALFLFCNPCFKWKNYSSPHSICDWQLSVGPGGVDFTGRWSVSDKRRHVLSLFAAAFIMSPWLTFLQGPIFSNVPITGADLAKSELSGYF